MTYQIPTRGPDHITDDGIKIWLEDGHSVATKPFDTTKQVIYAERNVNLQEFQEHAVISIQRAITSASKKGSE